MVFRQIYDEGLAQASYFFGCTETGEAMVIDARRDIDVYLSEAEQRGMQIVAVGETHIHADYLSGARELAYATGATLYLSDEGGDEWRYRGLDGFRTRLLKHNDSWMIGNLRVQAIHTPGHTPEHITYLLYESKEAVEPVLAITGDFMFVGDLGRPDLLEEAVGEKGSAELGALRQFQSLSERFLSFPDYLQIWPGHGAGSACGKALGALPVTTLGYERRYAWWAKSLLEHDAHTFVQDLLRDQPEVPPYFARMKQLNRDGVPLLGSLPQPPLLTPSALAEWQKQGAVIVDTRNKDAFARGHLPGSFHIPASRQFSTWAGWLLPYDKPLVLIAEPYQTQTLVRQLIRVGFDTIVGIVPSLELSMPLAQVHQLNVEEAKRFWDTKSAYFLDVRGISEYREGHIPGALPIPVGSIQNQREHIPHDRPLILYCLSGERSSIALSALEVQGFTQLYNLTGGFAEWALRGYPIEK